MVMKTANRMALVSALALAGCTADYVKSGNAPVKLVITGFSLAVLDSDVEISNGGVCPDEVSLAVANRPKNPNVTVGSTVQDVVVNRYEVSYSRSDGRATQGVDVPYSISGTLAVTVPAASSGTTSMFIEVVRRQAKLEPPMIELVPSGQALIVTMFAKVTLYGTTLAGENVTASATLQVDMANFGDTDTTCPKTN
jgi:hypothetical protein